MQLARAAAAGDQSAFALVVDRHGSAMLRYARRLMSDRGDAEDVVQDALVSAWRGLDGYRGDSSLRTWLFTLTSRRAADVIRRRPARTVVIEPGSDEAGMLTARSGLSVRASGGDPYGIAAAGELVAALDAALQTLPWRQRAVWVLREVEGMSYQEIAVVLATRPDVVRGQLARARPALAERMVQWR